MYPYATWAAGDGSSFISPGAALPAGVGGWVRIFVETAAGVVGRPEILVAFVLWQLAILYAIPVVFWDFEIGVYLLRNWQNRRSKDMKITWELDAVQVRIVTVDNAEIVQQTIDALPDGVGDVVVIAERPIEVTGARVLAVPPEFECAASHKGRAVEWARRNYPTDCEYVLYMDEDTDASNLTGLPSNADIIQFREQPSRSGGLVPFLAEVHRIGFNTEQRAFPFFRLPFYAWGGGIAIRSSLERRVTWDTPTIVEDSVFAWRAVLEHDATVDVVDVSLVNQAPPSVWAMIKQRRRWLTGTRQQQELLPLQYRLMSDVRDLGWALSTFGPVLWVLSALSYLGVIDLRLLPVFFPEAYAVLTITLLGHVYAWSLVGIVVYRPPLSVSIPLLIFTPFIVTIHSTGALYGLLRPAAGFAVTRKIVRGESASAEADATSATGTDGTEPDPDSTDAPTAVADGDESAGEGDCAAPARSVEASTECDGGSRER